MHQQRAATLSVVVTGGAATTPSFLQLTPELWPSQGNNFFVFALAR